MPSVISVKAAVRARDGFRCVECGMTNDQHRTRFGKRLEVHRLQPGTTYTVSGCVTLCKRCHGPKPRLPRGTRNRDVVPFPAELARDARIVAAALGMTFRAYVISVIREALARDFPLAAEIVARKAREWATR